MSRSFRPQGSVIAPCAFTPARIFSAIIINIFVIFNTLYYCNATLLGKQSARLPHLQYNLLQSERGGTRTGSGPRRSGPRPPGVAERQGHDGALSEDAGILLGDVREHGRVCAEVVPDDLEQGVRESVREHAKPRTRRVEVAVCEDEEDFEAPERDERRVGEPERLWCAGPPLAPACAVLAADCCIAARVGA